MSARSKTAAITMPADEIRRRLVRESNGQRFCTRQQMALAADGEAECPLCRKSTNLYVGSDAPTNWRDPRAYGFRKSAFERHVWGCTGKHLAAIGLERGRWNADEGAPELHPIETKRAER